MTLNENIRTIRTRKGLTQKEVAKRCNIADSAIRKYESGKVTPKYEMLEKIANALDVPVTALYGYTFAGTDENGRDIYECPSDVIVMPDLPIKLEKSEEEIIKKYRALDQDGQDTVLAVIDCESKRCKKAVSRKAEITAVEDNVIPFRRSEQAASAGTGIFLGPDEFETIYVQENSLTRRASFGVPVRGDSMEPKYHDGDLLLVEKSEVLSPGEIGVFTLDGSGYVKKLGEGVLISLNPKYDPIPMTEDIYCNGRVIGVMDPEWIVEK